MIRHLLHDDGDKQEEKGSEKQHCEHDIARDSVFLNLKQFKANYTVSKT